MDPRIPASTPYGPVCCSALGEPPKTMPRGVSIPFGPPQIEPIYPDTFSARYGSRLAGAQPRLVERFKKMHGRYLAGFGGQDMTGAVGYDPKYQGQLAHELEYEDDVNGSGIFDQKGRQATSNADMGVFASHYSLPGFIAREVPFRVNRDVTDITDDAAVVTVPAGGMAYVEKEGQLACIPDPDGTCRKRTQITPAPPTGQMQPYAFMSCQQPIRRPVHRVPKRPFASRVPFNVARGVLPRRSIVAARQSPVPVQLARRPVAASAPGLPAPPDVPFRSTVNVGPTRSVPVSGFGQSDTVKWGIGGVVAGAAVALVLSAAGIVNAS